MLVVGQSIKVLAKEYSVLVTVGFVGRSSLTLLTTLIIIGAMLSYT